MNTPQGKKCAVYDEICEALFPGAFGEPVGLTDLKTVHWAMTLLLARNINMKGKAVQAGYTFWRLTF